MEGGGDLTRPVPGEGRERRERDNPKPKRVWILERLSLKR